MRKRLKKLFKSKILLIIINYGRQNVDITKQDLVDKSPFSDYDVVGLFNDLIDVLTKVINSLHESILVA